MTPALTFLHCPKCGLRRPRVVDETPLRCDHCGFVYYFNPTVAAAAILLQADGRGLFIRRAKEPSQGMLGLVGGFIDIGETAETALRREVREEVNLEIRSLRFLCSEPNRYVYREVTYPVLDLFFVATVEDPQQARALDEVASFAWLDPQQVNPAEMAFPSMSRALELFQSGGYGASPTPG